MTETQTNQPEFRNEWAKILYTANIVDVCNALNIELTKIGRLYRGVEHDSLVITPRTNSFSWNSRNIGGRGGGLLLRTTSWTTTTIIYLRKT